MNKYMIPLALCALMAAGCSDDKTNDAQYKQVNLSRSEVQITKAQNAFSITLLKAAAREKGEVNMVISPWTIQMVASMIANGTENPALGSILEKYGAASLSELNSCNSGLLNELPQLNPSNVTVKTAFSIWADKGSAISEPFKASMLTNYNATTHSVDFKSQDVRNMVNEWAKASTNGLIPEYLKNKVDPSVSLILCSSVYFAGTWANEYEAEDKYFYNEDNYLHSLDQFQTRIPFVSGNGNVRFARTDKYVLMAVPYGNGNYEMAFVTPFQSSPTKAPVMTLQEMIRDLSEEEWLRLLDSGEECKARHSFPKMDINFNEEITRLLAASGLNLQQDCFKGITPDGARGWRFQHGARLIVNEKGTKGASVTSGEFSGISSGGVHYLDKNSPFVYFVREASTGTILFAGTFYNK